MIIACCNSGRNFWTVTVRSENRLSSLQPPNVIAPLICRACGAMAMGAGLGFPVGVSAPLRFHPQPPICISGLNMFSPCFRRNHHNPLLKRTKRRQKLARSSGHNFAQEVSSANRLGLPWPPNGIAPLICRIVRAMRAVRVLGAGLGFPLGGTFGFAPPNSDLFNLF